MEQQWYERMTPQQFEDYEDDMIRMDLEKQFDFLMENNQEQEDER